jgi:hypothetical protein
MEKCKLCKKRDADKKGSHIVPHLLLKRIENIDGKTDRDYELGFTIEKHNVSSHFGRSLQPERLEKTYGEVTDDDIAKNKHPLIVDYFFCSFCEDRLAIIESEYSKTINNIGEGEYKSGVKTLIGILFWGSILWRISINGKSGVKLSHEQNETLRSILDTFLPDKIENLDENLLLESDFVKQTSYKLLRFNNRKNDDATWLVFHPSFFKILCLFIDEYILAFSLNDDYDELNKLDCFDANDLIIQASKNKIGGDEVIKTFDRSDFTRIGKVIVNKAKDTYLEGVNEFLDKLHVEIGGQGSKMPDKIKHEIINELAFEEKKLGRKYTQKELAEVTFKILKKYAP